LDGSFKRFKDRIKREWIVTQIKDRSFKGNIYLVGGAIRELFLNRTPNDYDIVLTEGVDLERLESLFGATAFVLGKKPIQTYRIVQKNTSIDVTIFHGEIKEDLLRRDFTMNAIAYDINNDEILDPLNGIEDIKKGIIKYPGVNTLKEDPLRMLKAIRHYSTLNGFVLHQNLKASIKSLKGLIKHSAPERVKYELDRIITSDRVYNALKLMDSIGLLFEIFPELEGLRHMDKERGFSLETFGHTIKGFRYLKRYGAFYRLDDKSIKDTGYALLFHDLGKTYTFSYDEHKGLVHFFNHERVSNDIATFIMERLRFSQNEIKSIKTIIECHMRIFLISGEAPTERPLKRIIYKLEDLTPSLIVHTLCDMYGSSSGKENPSTRRVKRRCDQIWEMYEEWKRTPIPKLINGYDLMKLGLEEGPEIGRILNMIREKQISGEVSSRDEALFYAKTIIGNTN